MAAGHDHRQRVVLAGSVQEQVPDSIDAHPAPRRIRPGRHPLTRGQITVGQCLPIAAALRGGTDLCQFHKSRPEPVAIDSRGRGRGRDGGGAVKRERRGAMPAPCSAGSRGCPCGCGCRRGCGCRCGCGCAKKSGAKVRGTWGETSWPDSTPDRWRIRLWVAVGAGRPPPVWVFSTPYPPRRRRRSKPAPSVRRFAGARRRGRRCGA